MHDESTVCMRILFFVVFDKGACCIADGLNQRIFTAIFSAGGIFFGRIVAGSDKTE